MVLLLLLLVSRRRRSRPAVDCGGLDVGLSTPDGVLGMHDGDDDDDKVIMMAGRFVGWLDVSVLRTSFSPLGTELLSDPERSRFCSRATKVLARELLLAVVWHKDNLKLCKMAVIHGLCRRGKIHKATRSFVWLAFGRAHLFNGFAWIYAIIDLL